jgi:hypothetical protein
MAGNGRNFMILLLKGDRRNSSNLPLARFAALFSAGALDRITVQNDGFYVVDAVIPFISRTDSGDSTPQA